MQTAASQHDSATFYLKGRPRTVSQASGSSKSRQQEYAVHHATGDVFHPSSVAFDLAFRCRLSARIFSLRAAAASVASKVHVPFSRTSSNNSRSHPTLVNTSASICDVSTQCTEMPAALSVDGVDERSSFTCATKIFTLMSEGCPASLLTVLSRLLASVKANSLFLGNSLSRFLMEMPGFSISRRTILT